MKRAQQLGAVNDRLDEISISRLSGGAHNPDIMIYFGYFAKRNSRWQRVEGCQLRILAGNKTRCNRRERPRFANTVEPEQLYVSAESRHDRDSRRSAKFAVLIGGPAKLIFLPGFYEANLREVLARSDCNRLIIKTTTSSICDPVCIYHGYDVFRSAKYDDLVEENRDGGGETPVIFRPNERFA